MLASDVQVNRPDDRDRLRFALTGEGGLNDGTAFPFVMLGLGLLGLHEIGEFGWRWLLVDGLWATFAGLGVGALLGLAVGRLVLYLRREHKEAVGLDDFLAMGLIALSYGVALLLHAYGFLAVFAAGVALRHLEQSESSGKASQQAVEQAKIHPDRSVAEAVAVDPQHAPAYMAQAVLGFNQQVERIGELAVVITIGALLWSVRWHEAVWWFVPLLLLLIRPVSVGLGLLRSPSSSHQRWLIGWFGIRGIGSLYYLLYAINHGVSGELADQLTALTLSVVVTSIIVHGISVTPLMAAYERTSKRRSRDAAGGLGAGHHPLQLITARLGPLRRVVHSSFTGVHDEPGQTNPDQAAAVSRASSSQGSRYQEQDAQHRHATRGCGHAGKRKHRPRHRGRGRHETDEQDQVRERNQTLSMGLRSRCRPLPPARPCPDRTVASALVLHSKAAATDRMCIGLA